MQIASNRPTVVSQQEKQEISARDGWGTRAAAFALIALPFVIFVWPSPLWQWCIPLIWLVAFLIARSWPLWKGHALFWSVFATILCLRVPWPVSLILPLALPLVGKRWSASLRDITSRLRWGRFDRGTALLAVPIVVTSTVGLVLWFRLATPDVSNITAMVPRSMSLGMGILGMVIFSAANALWEELLMKWVAWDGLERLFGAGWGVIVLQAFFFGLLHYHGFPRGVMGVLLAGGYGLLLGIVRAQAGGLLALIVTHFFADIVICLLVASTLNTASL